MMVFRTSERISYALVMEVTTPIALLDTVRNPVAETPKRRSRRSHGA